MIQIWEDMALERVQNVKKRERTGHFSTEHLNVEWPDAQTLTVELERGVGAHPRVESVRVVVYVSARMYVWQTASEGHAQAWKKPTLKRGNVLAWRSGMLKHAHGWNKKIKLFFIFNLDENLPPYSVKPVERGRERKMP